MSNPRRIVEFDASHASKLARSFDGPAGKNEDLMRMHREGLTAIEIAELTGRSTSEVWRAIYDALAPLRHQQQG